MNSATGSGTSPRLRTLLEESLPANVSFDDFQVEHDFPYIGRKVMLLNFRHLRQAGAELILLTIEDVTERRRVEAKRHAIETRFTSPAKNIRGHSILTLNPDGRVTSWNVAAGQILGYTETEATGQHFSFIFTTAARRESERPLSDLRLLFLCSSGMSFQSRRRTDSCGVDLVLAPTTARDRC